MYRDSMTDGPTSLPSIRTIRKTPQLLKCIDASSDFCPCHLAE